MACGPMVITARTRWSSDRFGSVLPNAAWSVQALSV